MSKPQPVPAHWQELPFARLLPSPTTEVPDADVIELVRLADCEVNEARWAGAKFSECVFTSVTLTGGSARKTRLSDIWFETVRCVGLAFAEGTWVDVSWHGSVLAGIEAYGANLRRVRLVNCKLDSVNLREARLREVTFENCTLRDVDLAGATLETVTFAGCRIEGLRLDRAKLKGVDLRGVRELHLASGYEGLRGSIMDSGQLMSLAPQLAASLGIIVADS
jgi:uncharacterized protein YjbI with pentapeptide repeats